MRKPNLNNIIEDNLDKAKFQSKVQPSLPTDGWLNGYRTGGTYISDRAKATQFGQYAEGGSSWMLTNPNRISTFFPRMNNGGGLLSRKVTCSNCGWSWKAVDGGKDVMTCHKCGGMIKMKKGGMITDPMGQWAHPGENTRIPGGNITMQGVPYPVLAKASNGMTKMMYPEQEYNFPGADYVDEYPMMGYGGYLPKAQYGCNGKSCSQTGFGMDMGLGDPQKSGKAFDNWKSYNTPVGWDELLTYNSTDLTGKDLKNYNKDITARTKSLQTQFPGLTEDQLRVAGADSARIRQRMTNLPRYDQPIEQTFDKAYHQFYRPLMNQSTPVTVPQILNYQSQQPGGLGGFQTTVTGNYGRKKAQYGGWLSKYQEGGTQYTVKKGDTLGKIGKQFGMTPQEVAQANDISNIDFIRANQVLNIPTLAPAVQPVVDASFVGPQVTAPQPRESVIQAPTNVRRVQAPVTQERVVSTRQKTPQLLNVQQPKTQTQAPASVVLGEAPPLFKTVEDREAWRQRLKQISKDALSGYNNDEKYLVPLVGIKDASGNEMTWNNDENCISGICGLNKAAGMEYNAGTYQGRYIGNQTFYDNVNNHKEDYYRVNGNFQGGDHIQLTRNGSNPYHSMEIYDSYNDDDGNRWHRVIHNGGTTQFKENLYTDEDLKDMIADGRAIINRPGYSLDKELLKKEREAATSPEARAALEKKKQLIDYQTSHDPNYQYAIREDSPQFKDQPTGMKKFIEFANNTDKINELVKKLGVDKDVIHDELLNTFGELGQENKWENPTFGGSLGLENTWEKIATTFGGGKNLSVGPGQIKFQTLDPELKKKFNIKNANDLYDWDKVIPLMTAINIKNRQWMERKGTDLSKFLIGQPGATASDLKYGMGRWTPYMYRGKMSDPEVEVQKEIKATINKYVYGLTPEEREEEFNKMLNSDEYKRRVRKKAKVLDEGSYADKVYHNIENNLQRTLPYSLDDGQYRGMQPVIIQAKTKKKALGGQHNWLNNYK